jgi:DNA-3-methyladenine glycosylase II
MDADSPFQAAADALAARDEKLAVAIAAVGPCRLVPNGRAPYEALLNAIAHQQVHGAAAKAILGRMHALYARDGAAPRWPTPQELVDTPEDALRGAGLSRSKVLAMRDVAAKTLDGTVPDLATIARLSNEAIVERLVAVRGVGRWTAEMLLIFTLGRPDVLPVDDFGVRHGFQLLHGRRQMPKPRWLAGYGERWAPHRSTVAWYLWRYVDWVRANGAEPRRARANPAKRAARATARRAKAASARGRAAR